MAESSGTKSGGGGLVLMARATWWSPVLGMVGGGSFSVDGGNGKALSGVSESVAVVWRWAASVSRARHFEGQVDAKLAHDSIKSSGAPVKAPFVAPRSSGCFGSSARR